MPINTIKGMDKIINYNDYGGGKLVKGWVMGSLSLQNTECVGSKGSCVGTYRRHQDQTVDERQIWQLNADKKSFLTGRSDICTIPMKRPENTQK